ncbi:MAG: FAD-binding protein [Desulfobacterales bacterium]|jgi:succinate dehydrogenase/fumarate reductase flavoprotein subunit
MLVRIQEKLSCDVLVIGGGGAGLRSVIAAKSRNADVLLISKTKLGTGSNTYISKAVIAAIGWGTPDDNEKTHVVDTVTGGRFLNDQAMVAKVALRSHSEITFLKECGVNFDMREGALRVIKIPGQRKSDRRLRRIRGSSWIRKLSLKKRPGNCRLSFRQGGGRDKKFSR